MREGSPTPGRSGFAASDRGTLASRLLPGAAPMRRQRPARAGRLRVGTRVCRQRSADHSDDALNSVATVREEYWGGWEARV